MTGIARKKNSLKISKAIGIGIADFGARKTNGKPKLPVN